MRCGLALSFCLAGLSVAATVPVRSSSTTTTTTVKSTTTTTTVKPTTTTTTVKPTTTTTKPSCPYSTCIQSSDVPAQNQREATAYCSNVLKGSLSPVTSTATVTTFATTTVTPAPTTVTVTTITTATTTVGTTCTGTPVTVPASTFVSYPTGTYGNRNAARSLDERQLNVPNFVASRCKGAIPPSQSLKAACSCLVTPSTTTVTATATSTVTVTAAASTATTTATSTATVSSYTCTSTVVPTSTQVTACGTSFSSVPTASATGSITCASPAPSPSAYAFHRIEGNDSEGTIFEGCILSGPRNLTTASGGTHLCDGTNGGANPSPGATITGQAAAAGDLLGFDLDGPYYDRYRDFFIQRIGATSSTGSQYWGVLRNQVFTPTGGCQERVNNGDQTQWFFDAFSVRGGLNVSPGFATAQAGQGIITLTVSMADLNGGGSSPFGGASIGGQTSDGNGQVTLPIPTTPGCYQYKATASGYIRSNAFYLSVYDQFASA